MPEIPDVAPNEIILSGEWGNPIRSRTVQRYASATERDALVPLPESGDLAWLEDTATLTIHDGTEWLPAVLESPPGRITIDTIAHSETAEAGELANGAGTPRVLWGQQVPVTRDGYHQTGNVVIRTALSTEQSQAGLVVEGVSGSPTPRIALVHANGPNAWRFSVGSAGQLFLQKSTDGGANWIEVEQWT